MTDQGTSGTARTAMDAMARTNNQIQQNINAHQLPTHQTLLCWQGAVANAHTALGVVLGAYREANDGHIAARRTLGELKQIVGKPTAGDSELKDIVAHLQTYQDSTADEDGSATDQLSKIAAALGVDEDKDLSLEVEQLDEDLRKSDEDYTAASRVLHEVREALGVPAGADVVAHARMIAQTKDKLAREQVPALKRSITDMLGLPADTDDLTVLQEIGRRDREVSRAEGVRTEIKPILGLPNDASDAALIEAVKRIKRQQDAEQSNREENETPTSRYAKFKADVAQKLGLSKHMAVERAIFNEVDNLQNQLHRADDFGARIRNVLSLPVGLPDYQVVASAGRIKHIKDKNVEALDEKNAQVSRQAAEIEKMKVNSGRINGRPVTQALSDLVLTRKRQPYDLETDRNMPVQVWGGILKDEAQHFNFLARRDGDSRTNRLRNAALKIAGICLAFVEALDGVTTEDLKQ